MGHKLTKDWASQQIAEGKYRESRMVTVTDDWFPNFPDNKVELRINAWMGEHNKATVIMSVWGADDDYVVLRSEPMSPVYAINLYKHWKEYVFDRVPDGCDHEWFFEHGFYYD